MINKNIFQFSIHCFIIFIIGSTNAFAVPAYHCPQINVVQKATLSAINQGMTEVKIIMDYGILKATLTTTNKNELNYLKFNYAAILYEPIDFPAFEVLCSYRTPNMTFIHNELGNIRYYIGVGNYQWTPDTDQAHATCTNSINNCKFIKKPSE